MNPIAKAKQASLNASFIEIGVLMEAISKQVELDIDDTQMLLIDLISENKEIIKILHSDYKTRYKSWMTTDRSYIWNGCIDNSEKIRLRDANINLTFKITEEVIRKGRILDMEQEYRVLGFCRQQMMEIFSKDGHIINLSADIDPSSSTENKSQPQPISALNAEVAALHQQLTAPFSPTPTQERKAEAPEAAKAANDHPEPTQNTLPVVGALGEPAKTGPPPVNTRAMADSFADLHWNGREWLKKLGNKPKWLEACLVLGCGRGEGMRRWDPVLIGAYLVNRDHVKANSVRARFQTKPALIPWLEAWKTYEADNFTTC
jgi:hypothetical protein